MAPRDLVKQGSLNMQKPPFKLALASVQPRVSLSAYEGPEASACCDVHSPAAQPATAGRSRLAQLDPNFHCSVIGTCLATAELRRIVSRYLDVVDARDVDIHHDAVTLAHGGGAAAKALHKALDSRHDATLRVFATARDSDQLGVLWDEAMASGDIPGAYWALLTHPNVTQQLRQRAFGDVHMLSHLVGSANRADIRRLASLENENRELAERMERQQTRAQEAMGQREAMLGALREELFELQQQVVKLRDGQAHQRSLETSRPGRSADLGLVAIHSERRERAEQALASTSLELERLQLELAHTREHTETLSRELDAAEAELRDVTDEKDAKVSRLDAQLGGRRVLYVGGRPSSTPAIRDLVLRHRGTFKGHDGGLEDRKGLLASAVSAADLVVFPVDCIDHDSASNLKRLCGRHGVPFIPLRSASVASFAAAMAALSATDEDSSTASGRPFCIRHG